jgi:DNA helicase-2/ATP-dependent DNA helicase PcrA
LIPSIEKLNPEQRKAVEVTEGPVLILAGAGSGKTRVLTVKIAYMIHERRISPGDILAMTFTKKAAEEMRSRIRKLIGNENGLWIGTFHSVFAKILRREAPLFGYSTDFVIYDKEDQERLVKQVLEALGHSPKQYAPRMIAALISRSKNSLITPQEVQSHPQTPVEKVVGEAYAAYQNALRANQAFDFDDLITVPLEIFRTHPSVLQKYQSRFRYLLVDEYQDTNRAQYMLVSALAKTHRNLCVVGDDDQSIYGWRGADLRNILEFEKDFPETAVFRLEQNYRSTKNILKAASSLVDKNVHRKKKTLWSDREPGEPLELLEVEDEREEAHRVVENIRDEVFRKKRNFNHFAVLYRTNAQSRAIEDGLRKSGISYVIVGGVRFYERKEIKDILAYLKVVSNPRDSLSLKRIINFPIRGIGDTSMQKIETWAARNGLDLYDTLARIDEVSDIPGRIARNAKGFHDLIRKYITLKDAISPGELVHALVDEIGLIKLYKDDTSIEGQGKLENIREFLSAVHEYTKESESPSLSGFLEEIALLTDIDNYNPKSAAVTLMTVHCAKGLEFPVVFVVGLEEGLFPLSRTLENLNELEEERRLFYVALTRAKEKVILLWSRTRNVYNSEGYRMASRFLDEIDASVIHLNRDEPRRSARKAAFSRDDDSFDREFETPVARRVSFRKSESFQSGILHGQRVEHEIFGRGKVEEIEGSGPRQTCTVRFEDGIEKKFLVRFARLRITE